MGERRRPPLTLPLALRDRLAELILTALREPGARRTLVALAARQDARAEWMGPAAPEHGVLFTERVQRAEAAVRRRPLARDDAGLGNALADAAALFDAGLYFEVHELLEPHWLAATGAARETLQGLIQIAVGYQHLANGNGRGARALLEEGAARIAEPRLGALDLAEFARGVRATIPRLADGQAFDWTQVPPFPAAPGLAR